MRTVLWFLMSVLLCVVFIVTAEEPRPVLIGLDAEFGLPHSTSAQPVERGILVALDEINRGGGVLGGRPLKLLTKDNHSMPARGIKNVSEFAQMQDLVAVYSARFSPVVLEALPTLAKYHLINLAPWSSADGVTENRMRPNYVFRLSLKDRFAMPTMLKHAVKVGATKVGLLLTNTSWGRSNLNAAQRYLATVAVPHSVGTVWTNWRAQSLLNEYNVLKRSGAGAIILVVNDDAGATLVTEVAALPKAERLPIISHWGVTGGNFIGQMGDPNTLEKVQFSVVQTFSPNYSVRRAKTRFLSG